MKFILFALSAAALVGCAHESPETVVIRDPATFPPASPSNPDPATIRREAIFKAYPLGRYVDANDPQMMHEGHVLYVEESSPTWNLEPHSAVHVPLGPAVGAPDSARSQPPSADEWRMELNEQRQATRVIQEQAARLNRTLEQLSGAIPLTQKLAEHTQALQEQQQVNEQRLKLLEEASRQLPLLPAPTSLATNTPATNTPPATIRKSAPKPDVW